MDILGLDSTESPSFYFTNRDVWADSIGQVALRGNLLIPCFEQMPLQGSLLTEPLEQISIPHYCGLNGQTMMITEEEMEFQKQQEQQLFLESLSRESDSLTQTTTSNLVISATYPGENFNFNSTDLTDAIEFPSVVDRIVGKSNVPYYFDPEYFVVNSERILMTYRDEINRIWLTKIDPLTGAPTSPGKGVFLGTTVPEVQGPEFGFDSGGLAVYYTSLDQNGLEQVFKTPLDGNFVPEQLTFDLEDNTKVVPTQNFADPEVRVSYFSRDAKGMTRFVAAKENSADDTVRVPLNFGDGGNEPYQWIPERSAILTSLKDQDGFYQVARFDVETERTLILTNDSSNKADAKIYEAPEYDSRLLYAVIQDTSEIAFYLFNEMTGNFDSLTTLTVPTELGLPEEIYLDSVEAFSLQGQTYVVAAIGLQENVVGPRDAILAEELWIMSLDQQQDPINLQINSEGVDPFFDPEVIIPNPSLNKALISYWTSGFPNELHTVEITFPSNN